MLITKLSLQRKSKAFNIFIDNKYSFSLDKDELVKEQLKVGLEISEKRLLELKFKGKISYLISRAFNFLSYRPRSITEVKRKLSEILYKDKDLEKEVKAEAIEKVIEKLKTLGFLNDMEFGNWLIAQRTASRKPHGNNRIKTELFKKGLDRELIAELLEEKGKGGEAERALLALAKKEKQFGRLEPKERKKRAFAYLVRQGFEFELIYSVIDTFFKTKYNDSGSENGLEI